MQTVDYLLQHRFSPAPVALSMPAPSSEPLPAAAARAQARERVVPAHAPHAHAARVLVLPSSSDAAPTGAPAQSELGEDGHSINEIVSYHVQKLFRLHLLGKLVVIAAFCSLLVAAGGALYARATGEPLPGALFTAYSVLVNTPFIPDNEHGVVGLFVANVLFLLGLFSFAVFIGTVSDAISAKVEEVQAGNYSIVERGHTVLLGWNDQTVPLLRQMAACSAGGGATARVAVLADLPREEMEEAVAPVLEAYPSFRVVVRSGKPMVPADLHRVAASTASRVVLLHPKAGGGGMLSPEEAKAATLLALCKAEGWAGASRVVVQMSGKPAHDLVALAAERRGAAALGSVGTVDGHWALARQMAHCALFPGLGQVYEQIFTRGADGADLTVAPLPRALAGRTFGDAWRSCEHTVLGIMRRAPDGAMSVLLAPPDSAPLLQGDGLALLAPSQRDAGRLRATPLPQQPPSEVPLGRSLRRSPVRVLVAGLERPSRLPVLSALALAAPPQSHITVLSEALGEAEIKAFSTKTVAVRLVRGSPTNREAMAAAGADRADSVLLLRPASCAGGDAERDAASALALLQLRQLRAEGGAAPGHVVVEVQGESEAGELLRRATGRGGRCDTLDADALVAGHMLGDLASPLVSQLAGALLSPTVPTELVVKRASDLLPHSAAALSCGRAAGLVRDRGDLLVGYLAADSGQLVLNPGKDTTRVWAPDDRLVVLSTVL